MGEGAVGAEDAELVVDAIVASGIYDMQQLIKGI